MNRSRYENALSPSAAYACWTIRPSVRLWVFERRVLSLGESDIRNERLYQAKRGERGKYADVRDSLRWFIVLGVHRVHVISLSLIRLATDSEGES